MIVDALDNVTINAIALGSIPFIIEKVAPTNSFFISGSGNVGIGTNAPLNALDVIGDVSASTYFGDGSNLTGISAGFWTGSDDYISRKSDVQISGSVSISGSLTTIKNVTFGNISSSATLEVVGDIVSTGLLWTERLSADEGTAWVLVSYGNGLFVSLQGGGGATKVMTSPDGINWTSGSNAEANNWRGMVYGNGLFVAVSIDGANRVMTSPDGINWTSRSATEVNTWNAVTYGNGLFVAVSDNGINQVMTSPDGINWTPHSSSEDNSWNAVTYGNGLFVAITTSGTNQVMTSPNGITWTARAHDEANNLQSLVYGNGLFVSVASTGTNRVMTSPDGITWTSRPAAANLAWSSVTYGNGLFVALAQSGTNRIMTSPDGITWISRLAPISFNVWNQVTYANGIFVAVAGSGTSRVMTSGKMEVNEPSHNNNFQGGMTIYGNVGMGVVTASATLHVSGAISASTYFGDGSNLTGISAGFWTGSDDYISRDSDVKITGSLYIATASINEGLSNFLVWDSGSGQISRRGSSGGGTSGTSGNSGTSGTSGIDVGTTLTGSYWTGSIGNDYINRQSNVQITGSLFISSSLFLATASINDGLSDFLVWESGSGQIQRSTIIDGGAF